MTKPQTGGPDSDDRPAGNAPLYQMLVRALKAEILSGFYPVGTALPSESMLVARFGVSRHTVREALRQLRDLDLVESRQGVGSLVLRPGRQQVYVHQVDSIADLHDFNLESRYQTEAEPLIVEGALADRLRVTPGERWLQIAGTRSLAEETVCAVEIYVFSRFAGIARLLGRRAGPIYSLIEVVYGESIAEVDQELRAVPIPDAPAATLGMEPGEIGVEIRRAYRLRDGQAAEITFNYYKASNFNFSMKLRRLRD